jgi:hypothetical protein
MTHFQRFTPCRAKSRFLIYRGFQLLDAAGPIAASEIAERHRPNGIATARFYGYVPAGEKPVLAESDMKGAGDLMFALRRMR